MAELDYQYIAKLVDKTKEGDSDAFAQLYAATYQKQYHYALGYLKDEYLAQDAIQEVYILVLKNIQKLKDSTVFISWLNQICFRTCFTMSQKQKQHLGELNESIFQSIMDGSFGGKMPGNQTDSQIDNRDLFSLVSQLPVNESQAIIMRYYNDLKLEDIAKLMHCSRSSVKRYLESGRKKLKEYLLLQPSQRSKKGELRRGQYEEE